MKNHCQVHETWFLKLWDQIQMQTNGPEKMKKVNELDHYGPISLE